MLKNLAIICVLAFGVSGQPNKAPGNKQAPTEQRHAAAVSSDSKDEQARDQHNQTNADSNSPTGNAPIERPKVWWQDSNWWLVLVAVLTGGVVGWQAWETRKAAKASGESAAYALAELELMKSEARARVEIIAGDVEVTAPDRSGNPYWQLLAHIKLHNVGKSEAYIVNCVGNAFSSEEESRNSANFSDITPLTQVIDPSKTVVSDISIIAFEEDIDVITDQILDSDILLFFRGFVEYETQGCIWHRDFGFMWIADDDEFPNSVTELQAGTWESEGSKYNREYQVPATKPPMA